MLRFRPTPRLALLCALFILWCNYLTTSRWAEVPGALNGWKWPWFGAALILATGMTLWTRTDKRVDLRGASILFAAGWALLVFAFVSSFPISTWGLVPFYDDWPPRFQATIEGVRLLSHGVVSGWNWSMLGGYQSSADVSQSLAVVAAIPVALFGGALGYHVLHAVLVVAIPLVVYADLAREFPVRTARAAGALLLVCVVGYFGMVMPSGDTNSTAGVLCAVIALTGSRSAERGRRWGGPMLAFGLTLALYTHAAFFLYTCGYLLLEAVCYRSWRLVLRLTIAVATAGVASLPVYWELLRFPEYFQTNNIMYAPVPIDVPGLMRRLYYNVEILFLPHRWFNDNGGLTVVTLPIILWVAAKGRGTRAGFYAWCALLTVFYLTIDVIDFGGYLFARALHMHAIFTPVVLAWFILEYAGSRVLAWLLIAVIGLYVHSNYAAIPHVTSSRDFDPALFDRLRQLDGALVLLESNPHRDLIVDQAVRPERTPFGVHFESLLAAETGRRYYAQAWDGFHWTPLRGQTVGGGAYRGRKIGDTPVDEFAAEMRKWGVRHLVVWSRATSAYLTQADHMFRPVWSAGRWTDFEFKDADPRDVVVASGSGQLTGLHSLGGTVLLRDVRAGDKVVVRANYFPAWTAHVDGQAVALASTNGQISFSAPADGTYAVSLVYPRRHGLMVVSLLALFAGVAGLYQWRRLRPESGDE